MMYSYDAGTDNIFLRGWGKEKDMEVVGKFPGKKCYIVTIDRINDRIEPC